MPLAMRVALLGAIASLGACTDVGGPPTATELSRVVTGQALARQSNGQFVLASQKPGELTEPQAQYLAATYAHTAGRWLRAAWESDRGREIDVETLRPCARAFYASSAFLDPPQGVSRGVRRLLGAKWLTSLCDAEGQALVSVAVPADAVELQVVDGSIKKVAGADFTSFGIPTSTRAIPPAPEEAAQTVSLATGRRVSLVPELVLPPPPYVPQLAKWKVTLDGPTTAVDTNGRKRQTTEVYFGFGETWHGTRLLLGQRLGLVSTIQDSERNGAILPLFLIAGLSDHYEPITVEQP